MLDIKNIRSVYFLGIGGIGMSALARYFAARGVRISGYDKTPTRLTDQLISEGMDIHFEDNPSRIPRGVDVVIYTPAVPKDLGEFIHIRGLGLPVYKRAEVLGIITRHKFTVAIAGTHGKTTITSMITHILMKAGKPVTALLGGISKNYNNNFITSGKEEIMVIEADEFDRSFLQLRPDVAIISSIDADHLDIYQSMEGLLESFSQFSLQVKPGGKVIFRSGLGKDLPVLPNSLDYAMDTWADVTVKDFKAFDSKHEFTIIGEGKVYENIRLQVPGRHNVENALAATAAANLCGVSEKDIIEGLNSYTGVKRRFDIRVDEPGKVYIDDYAHHPRELSAFIQSINELYPDKKATGIFQPHLYSRTRDFAEGFAASLDRLDQVILLDIYPAREKPIPGVDSNMIIKLMKSKNVSLVTKEELIPLIDKLRPELLLTIGAGDIDKFVEPIEGLMKGWQ